MRNASKMSTTTSKSSESTSLLIDSVRVARETEELANDTLDEIREQKTLLHRAWGNMRGMMDTYREMGNAQDLTLIYKTN